MKKVLYVLSVLTDEDTRWMRRIGTRRELGPGDRLIVEGTLPDAMYVVLDGRVQVATGDRVVAQVGSGEVMGEVSFVDGRAATATVTALVATSVLAVPRPLLEAKLAEDPAFAARFYRAVCTFLAARLRSTLGQLTNPGTDATADDELNLDELDAVSKAGQRFSRSMLAIE